MFQMDSIRNFFVSDAALTAQQLKRLSEHKYNIQNDSFCEPYLQPFWNCLTARLPLWLAPNLITVIGLSLNFISVIIILYYNSYGDREIPQWAFLLSALTIFLYQTLDGIDGKQARRTKTASPLGELFDHGCDALSQVLIGLQIGTAMRLQFYPNLFLTICLVGEMLFYFAHWQAYVSGKLTLNKFDCVESLFCAIVVCIVSGVCGKTIWTTEVGFTCRLDDLSGQWFVIFARKVFNGIKLNVAVIAASSIPAVYGMYKYFQVIFTEGAGKNGSTVAGTSILSPLAPFLLAVIPQVMIYSHRSSSTVFSDKIALYCFAFGFISAKITSKLVIAHLTKSPLTVWDTTFYGPLLIFINQYYDEFLPDYVTLLFCLVYCSLNLIIFCTETSHQICSHLRIECFKIPYPPPPD